MKKIFHHSLYDDGNASEYIIPKGKIDITSHGMGSGIYGLSQEYLQKNKANSNSRCYVFVIENPYIIETNDQSENYITASKTIMRQLQNLSDNSSCFTINDYILNNIAQNFIKIINDTIFTLDEVYKALIKFWIEYNNNKYIVEMPINYILKNYNFDGVISNVNVTSHSWNKGDVKFIKLPNFQYEDEMTVSVLLLRNGIEKPILDLKNNGYKLSNNDKTWIKFK